MRSFCLCAVIAVALGWCAPALGQVVDRDRAWHPRANGISDPKITALGLHPTDENIAYAGTSDGAIYRTDDGGETWTEVLRVFTSSRERTGRGLRRSSGNDDTELDSSGDEANIEDQLEEFFEDEKERIFEELVDELGEDEAEVQAEIEAQQNTDRLRDELESQDSATDAADEEIAELDAAIREITLHPTVPGVVFAATSDGLWRYDDQSARWQHIMSGLGDVEAESTSVIAAFSTPPQEDGEPRPRSAWVLAGTRGGLMLSTDAGDTWTTEPGTIGSAEIRRLAVHPTQRWRLAAATDRGVFVSYDGGDSWRVLFTSLGAGGDILSVAYDAAEDGGLFVGTADGLFAVEPGGSSRRVGGAQFPLPVFRRIEPLAPGELLVTTPRGVWLSEDGGFTFDELSRGLPTPSTVLVVSRRESPGELWVATDLGVYRWLEGRPPTVKPVEPVPYAELIHAAHTYAMEDVSTLNRYRRQLGAKRFLPRARLNAGRGSFYSMHELLTPVNVGGVEVGRRRDITGFDVFTDFYIYLQLTWGLDQIFTSTTHHQLRTFRRQAWQRRAERTDRVIRLTREWTDIKQIQASRENAPPEDRNVLAETVAELRRQEIEAYLDAAVGGVLTEIEGKETEP